MRMRTRLVSAAVFLICGAAAPAFADGAEAPKAASARAVGHPDATVHPSRARHHVWQRERAGSGPGRAAVPRVVAAASFDEGPPPFEGWVELKPPTVAPGLAYNAPVEPDYPPLRGLRGIRYAEGSGYGGGRPVIRARY